MDGNRRKLFYQRRMSATVADHHISTEEVVKYFLTSGSAPEQGYKACVSLKNLCNRYGKKRIETACERMLAFSSSPSIRTVSTLLKNSKEEMTPAEDTDNSNKYGITRGAGYF